MKWSTAYNFNLQRDVDIDEVMELRRLHGRNDPRAGALWCHKNCHDTETGSKLSSRKAAISRETGSITKRAHFAQWKSEHSNKGSSCEVYSLAKSKRESMDYANYYKQFESYLDTLVNQKEPYFISGFDKFDSEGLPDFRVQHSTIFNDKISKTEIHIIDENKRKKRRLPVSKIERDTFVIVIHISEYTPKQLADFEVGGIEHFRVKWDYCIKMLEDLIKREMLLAEDAKNKAIAQEMFEKRKEESNRIKSEIKVYISDASDNLLNTVNSIFDEQDSIIVAKKYMANKGKDLITTKKWDKIIRQVGTLIGRYYSMKIICREKQNFNDSTNKTASSIHSVISTHYAGFPSAPENADGKGSKFPGEIFDELINFLDKEYHEFPKGDDEKISDWNNIIKQFELSLGELANDERNQMLSFLNELKQVSIEDTEQFRKNHDPNSIVQKTIQLVEQRKAYFSGWIKIFDDTIHPKGPSKRGQPLAVKRLEKCNSFLNHKSHDEYVQLFFEGKMTESDFIEKFVDKDIFDGIEQGFNMLRINNSEWQKLTSDEKKKLHWDDENTESTFSDRIL